MKTMRVIASTLSFVLSAAPLAAQTVTTTPTTTTTTPTTTTTTPTTTTPTTTTPMTTTPTTTTPTTGTYDAMSIGNRKIARALFEAQNTEAPTGGTTTGTGTGTGTTTPGTGTTSRTLTLDQIAAMKQNGQGWGQVFKTMQARGLVTEKNLGQVISQHSKQQASRADTTTASNRTTDSADATTTAQDGKKHGSVSQGGGHGRNAGSTVSARGADQRGGGSSNGHGGGHGGGHGKTK